MSYLNYKSGNTYALSGTEYINPTHGTARLNIQVGSRTDKYGLTTDTTAKNYCKIEVKVGTKTAYIGRYSSYTTSSNYTTTSIGDVTTGGITYSVSNSQTTSYLGSYITISNGNPALTGSLYSSLTESTTVYKGSNSNTSNYPVSTSGDVYSVSNKAYSVHDSVLQTTDLNSWNSTGAIYSLSQGSVRSLLNNGGSPAVSYYVNSSASTFMDFYLGWYNNAYPNATLYTYDYSLGQEKQDIYTLMDYYPGTDMSKSTSITSRYELYADGAQNTGYYTLSGKNQTYNPSYGHFNYTTNFTQSNTGSFSISYTSSWNGLTGYFTNTSRKIIGNPWWGAGGAAFKKFIAFSTNNNSTVGSTATTNFYDKTGVRFILTATDNISFLNEARWKSLVSGADCMRYFSLAGNGPMAIMSVTASKVSGKSTTFSYKYTEGRNQNTLSIDAGLDLHIPTANSQSQAMLVTKKFSGTIRTYNFTLLSSRSSWNISASYSSNRYSYTKSSRSTSTQASLSSRSSYTVATVWRQSSTTTNNFNI